MTKFKANDILITSNGVVFKILEVEKEEYGIEYVNYLSEVLKAKNPAFEGKKYRFKPQYVDKDCRIVVHVG